MSYCPLSPVPLSQDGRPALDLGAGTGAASRAIGRAGGGPVVAVDVSLGMLDTGRAGRPPAAVAHACRLPFPDRSLGGVVAAFSLTHLDDPVPALVEARRVTSAGGAVLASSYAEDDYHPVKAAVDDALAAAGWSPPPWFDHLRTVALPALARPDRCARVAREAGLNGSVHAVRVPFRDLGPRALVEWRLGLAQAAPYVATLAADERTALVEEALARLGDAPPPLLRSVLVIAAVAR